MNSAFKNRSESTYLAPLATFRLRRNVAQGFATSFFFKIRTYISKRGLRTERSEERMCQHDKIYSYLQSTGFMALIKYCISEKTCLRTRPRGPMDKASDFESEDCGFDPHRGHFYLAVLPTKT